MASAVVGRKPASATARGKGSFTSFTSRKSALTVKTPAKTPPNHPSSSFFSGILTLGHARRGEGRTKVFDADFYIGADNCHAMSGVLFFYDKDNEYNQLEYDEQYFYYVWGRVARYDPASGINLFYAPGFEQGNIDVVGDIERLEFIGVWDSEADYCGGPLDFTFRRPAKFSITGAAWQCDVTQNTFFIDVEPYISSLAKGAGSSKAVMPFLFYFDPQGRFGKSDKKLMPRDNKVVTIEGCITNVTWGEDIDSPIQRFHVDVVSIAFVGDVGKSSDSTLLHNTLDPSTPTPTRGAGRFQSASKGKGKASAVASGSASQPPTPAAPTPSTGTTNLTPPVPVGHSMFIPGVDSTFAQWLKALPPATFQQFMAAQGQPQTPTFEPTPHNQGPPPMMPSPPMQLFQQPTSAQVPFGKPTHPQPAPPAITHHQAAFVPPGTRLIPATAQPHPATPPALFAVPQQGEAGPSGSRSPVLSLPSVASPPLTTAPLSTPTASDQSGGAPSPPVVQPAQLPLTVTPQQLLRLTADRQLRSNTQNPQAEGGAGKVAGRKRLLGEQGGDDGRGKQMRTNGKD
ncbi:hypothetical protein H1R20_g12433, partial [Candolleomyces eurysporus]